MRRRAVKDEQKQARRQMLLDVSWQLFQSTSYQALTINEVAERAGLAKGTVYLYFKTKEELFLSLQEQQLAAWFAEVNVQLQAMPAAPDPILQVSEILCETLKQRPGLTRLLAIMHSVLEQNIDFETALHFKQMLFEHVSHTGALLEQRLSFLTPGQGVQMLLRIHALAIGLQHLADPAPIVQRVLDEHELHIFAIDFASEFSATLQTLLCGVQYLATRS